MRKLILLTTLFFLCVTSGSALGAVSFTYDTDVRTYDGNWGDETYYWSFKATDVASYLANGYKISSAKLVITDVNNLNEPDDNDVLYISLLDNDHAYSPNFYSVPESNKAGDYTVAVATTLLQEDYYKLPSYTDEHNGPDTYTYLFDKSGYATIGNLATFIRNNSGYAALAFDQDCDYSYTGFTLTINLTEGGGTTQGDAVPEPASMLLLGTGLIAFAGVTRGRLRKK